ncbi:NADPH-dependent oxidoreductase [Bifidobacterium sp. SMB2]|uniref:NADPH-dependent oxidoreductase n=1 Tax=Bifidobacterium saimiriisciurei TaxID=2661627 RepID=A0ABX0CDD0_9BIFI|nr:MULTISPECIES: nitroreductase family protein [Bifidobacterium]NEG96971.1 NADPH-dependent oxidoreductase [Bifidobacterium sp. SMB2]NEH12555.1 NADPH-dependent oxidoreductase [Bifidobacterium saimiriisciurei]
MANTTYDLHNPTIATLLNRRSIRAFADESIPDDVVDTLESVAQHAASSQYLNDWSAIRVTDPDVAARLAEIGRQPYIAQAPLLYVFVLDEHRNARIAAAKGVDVDSDAFTLNGSYRFSQAQNDAVLALHAMETAAYSLGLGCVILGSLLNDVDGLIDLLKLPKYTYPVLGLAIGKPAQEPALKPRMPKSVQFFENEYPQSSDELLTTLADFDADVHKYYDLRNTERPVDAFSDQIANNAVANMDGRTVGEPAARQGFRLDR